MKRVLVIVSILVIVFVSCKDDASLTGPISSGRYEYKAYDSSGNLVVFGWLFIHTDNPPNINGTWSLEGIAPLNEIGPQTGSGELQGRYENDEISINLNPQYIDNNVCLSGSVEGESIIGLWQRISYSGVTNEGTFSAVKIN